MEPLLTRKDVCELFGIGSSTLDRWIAADQFPRPTRYGRRGVRWSQSTLTTFIEQQEAKESQEAWKS